MFSNMTISSIKRLGDIIATGGGATGSDSMGVYGLGKARTIAQYQDFSGVNYDRMWRGGFAVHPIYCSTTF